MKGYTDIFGKPLAKSEISLAVRYTVQCTTISAMKLQRALRTGLGRSVNILRLLEDAGVVSKATNGTRSVILRTEAGAINAALRQLRKGTK